jgi:hypothetical protein
MSHVQIAEEILESQWRPECVICKESVKLEESRADEDGQSVHEECYVSDLLGNELRFRTGAGIASGVYVFRQALTLTSKRGEQSR